MKRFPERKCCFSFNIFKDRNHLKTNKLNTSITFNTNNTNIPTNNTNRMVKHRIDTIDLTKKIESLDYENSILS